MKECVFCGVKFDFKNNSLEHIIPQSLGGVLKARGVLCKNCNNKLGGNIDNKLYEYFKIFDCLFGIKKERQTKGSFMKSTINGEEVRLYPGCQIYSPLKIEHIEKKSDEEVSIKSSWRIPKDNKKLFNETMEQANKFVEKNFPGQKFKSEISNETYATLETLEIQGYSNYVDLLIGYFKIAICFCAFYNKLHVIDKEVLKIAKDISLICDNKNNEDNKNDIYNRILVFTYGLQQARFLTNIASHRIHLICDDKSQKVYIIIGLFESNHLLFILNNNYQGNYERKDYIYDFIRCNELEEVQCFDNIFNEVISMEDKIKSSELDINLAFKHISNFVVKDLIEIISEIHNLGLYNISDMQFKDRIFEKLTKIDMYKNNPFLFNICCSLIDGFNLKLK